MTKLQKSTMYLIIQSIILITPVYAVDSISISDKQTEAIAVESKPDPDELRRTVRQYELSIIEMEESGGAYDERIGEESIGLGLAYKELGRYQKAVEAFKKSLHINRVNKGLDNPDQLPILELIIETHTAAGDWEALDEDYQYLYWASRRIYGEDDPQLLSVIYRLSKWHLNAYLTKYDPIPFKHVLFADKLFHDAIDVIETSYGEKDPRLIDALNGVAIANYHIASHILNANTFDFAEIRSSTLKMDRDENVYEEHIARYLFNESTQRTRRKVLSRVADIYSENPDLPVEDRATALVNLADWFFIYGWRGTALENYREAYQLLVDSKADPEKIHELFGEPVRIPSMTMNYPNNNNNVEEDKDAPYVKLSFDVTMRGCARKVRVIEESDPDNFKARKFSKKFLRSSLFRPQFKDGKTVRAKGMMMRLSGVVLEERSDPKLVSYGKHKDYILTKRCYNRR